MCECVYVCEDVVCVCVCVIKYVFPLFVQLEEVLDLNSILKVIRVSDS